MQSPVLPRQQPVSKLLCAAAAAGRLLPLAFLNGKPACQARASRRHPLLTRQRPLGVHSFAAVEAVGTVGSAVASPAADSLPPSPPAAWAAMEKDCQLVFNVEIRGKYIIPFTR